MLVMLFNTVLEGIQKYKAAMHKNLYKASQFYSGPSSKLGANTDILFYTESIIEENYILMSMPTRLFHLNHVSSKYVKLSLIRLKTCFTLFGWLL